MSDSGEAVKPDRKKKKKTTLKSSGGGKEGERNTLERVTKTEDFYYQQGSSKWNHLAALSPLHSLLLRLEARFGGRGRCWSWRQLSYRL